MTKQQALQEFRIVVNDMYREGKYVATRIEWRVFLNQLCREELITPSQCAAWVNHF